MFLVWMHAIAGTRTRSKQRVVVRTVPPQRESALGEPIASLPRVVGSAGGNVGKNMGRATSSLPVSLLLMRHLLDFFLSRIRPVSPSCRWAWIGKGFAAATPERLGWSRRGGK